jgi:hypothetical protein
MRSGVVAEDSCVPIRKESRHRYPPDWKENSERIRFQRAGGRCECTGECRLHKGRRCVERHGEPAVYARGKIVLTVAHLNHQPEDCREENLKAMCQRCHLRYDVQHHKTSRLKEQGQGELELQEARR